MHFDAPGEVEGTAATRRATCVASLPGEITMRSVYAGIRAVVIVCLLSPLGALAQGSGEREIQPDDLRGRETPLEAPGFAQPDIGGLRISAFAVGSFSYNSHIQMVPEFAGGAPTLADPKSTNFRFDKFGLSVSKVFASWLSARARRCGVSVPPVRSTSRSIRS